MNEEVAKFSFFRSFWEGMQDLENEERLALYDAMTLYAFTGQEPEFKGAMRALWKFSKPNIDSSIKGQSTGAKGGRPKKENPPLKPPVKTTPKTDMDMDRDMEKDRDMEMDALEIDPLDQSISNANASGDAAAADAAPPAAKPEAPKCPECGGGMRFDVDGMFYRCRDDECRGTVSVVELAGFKPGTAFGRKARPAPAWVCPECGQKVSCDKETEQRICPTHGAVEAVIRDV